MSYGPDRRTEVTRLTEVTHRISWRPEREAGAGLGGPPVGIPRAQRMLGAQRLELIGRVTAGIASDVSRLLEDVLHDAGLAREHLGRRSRVSRDLEKLQSTALTARSLTHMVLDLARQTPADPQPLDLSAEVRRVSPLLETLVEHGPELRFALPRGLPPVRVDRGQLQQVLLNLVTNAVQAAGEEPGAIVIATGAAALCQRGREPQLLHGSNDRLFLRVSDDGTGMDEDTRRRAFEPFFTTRSGATGLGLAAVAEMVRSWGGSIRIESRPGAGSIFTLLVPVA